MPTLSTIYRKLTRSLARRGAAGTVKVAVTDLADWADLQWRRARAESGGRRFDRRYGVDTAGIIPASQLDLPASQRADASNYQPIAPFNLQAIVRRLAIDCEITTFIDLGAGKGRALLLAAMLPFRRVVGVELSARLAVLARANARRFTTRATVCSPVEVVEGNATDHAFPDGPLVVFLYNPFTRRVMERVAANLVAAHGAQARRVVVVYFVPVWADVWDNVEFLECKINRRDLRVYDSGVADASPAGGHAGDGRRS